MSDRLDKLLIENCHSNTAGLDGLGNIEMPDLDRVLKNFRTVARNEENIITLSSVAEKKKASRPLRKLMIIAASTLVLLITSSMLSIMMDTPRVNALKFVLLQTIIQMKGDEININTKDAASSMQNTTPLPHYSDSLSAKSTAVENKKITEIISLEDIKNKIDFPVILAGYLPQGYSIKEVKWTRHVDGTNLIQQTYYNPDSNNMIILEQSTNWNNVNLSTVAPSESDVQQVEVMNEKAVIISGKNNSKHATWFRNNCKLDVMANVSQEEFIRILDKIKYSR